MNIVNKTSGRSQVDKYTCNTQTDSYEAWNASLIARDSIRQGGRWAAEYAVARHMLLAALAQARCVIDVGGGPAPVAAPSAASTICIDTSRRALVRALRLPSVVGIRGRAQALPLADACVDGVVASQVLSHLPDPISAAAVSEMLDVFCAADVLLVCAWRMRR